LATQVSNLKPPASAGFYIGASNAAGIFTSAPMKSQTLIAGNGDGFAKFYLTGH
jgi:hypothetical protein